MAVDYGDGQTQSYGFDAMGSRLQRQDSAAGTTNYAYDAANRLTGTTGAGASTYTNDADGNTLTGGGRTNAWDSQNRLASCTKSTPAANGGTTHSYAAYTYGADGLRRRAFSYTTTSYPGRINPPPPGPPATDYAYDGTMLVREGHAFGGSLTASRVTATYFQGAQGPCYRRDDTQGQTDAQGHRVTKARWYVYDGLGSVVGEVDPLGNLTSSPKYDVYGAVRSNGGSATSRQGFVGGLGHVSDTETGLIYMRARYYDPSTGRFASQDTGMHGVNWFVYASNNPTNLVDKDGKDDGSINQQTVTRTIEVLLMLAFLCAAGLILRGIAMTKAGYAVLLEGEKMVFEGESLESGSFMLIGLLTAVSGGASMVAGVSCFASGLELFVFAACMMIMVDDISETDLDYIHKAMGQ